MHELHFTIRSTRLEQYGHLHQFLFFAVSRVLLSALDSSKTLIFSIKIEQLVGITWILLYCIIKKRNYLGAI
jgi:hypothetical protein